MTRKPPNTNQKKQLKLKQRSSLSEAQVNHSSHASSKLIPFLLSDVGNDQHLYIAYVFKG